MNYGQVVAVWYVGLMIFGLNGLLIMYHCNQVAKHQQSLERAQRLIHKHIRKRRGV